MHIIGDIYDRGYGSHFVIDSLMSYHSLDIQWGNHDVLWMGAFAGQTACIANIVRTSLLYDNLSVLENGYGISMMPLVLLQWKHMQMIPVHNLLFAVGIVMIWILKPSLL